MNTKLVKAEVCRSFITTTVWDESQVSAIELETNCFQFYAIAVIRTFYASNRWLRRPCPWPGAEAVTIANLDKTSRSRYSLAAEGPVHLVEDQYMSGLSFLG